MMPSLMDLLSESSTGGLIHFLADRKLDCFGVGGPFAPSVLVQLFYRNGDAM